MMKRARSVRFRLTVDVTENYESDEEGKEGKFD